ncbi:MAG: hypothetical protein COA79_22125 [Planctomycetota bacterium]|nr:MAG: hypothetical protein COA79_22125 [Planctomycetota bacterium]
MTKVHHKEITNKEELIKKLRQLEIYMYPKVLEELDVNVAIRNLVIKYYGSWENYTKNRIN